MQVVRGQKCPFYTGTRVQSPSRSNLADTARADLVFCFSLQKAYIWQHRQAVLIDRCQTINKQKTEWVLLLNYALLCLWQNSHCLYDLQAHKYCLILGNKLSVLFIMAPLAKLLCVLLTGLPVILRSLAYWHVLAVDETARSQLGRHPASSGN